MTALSRSFHVIWRSVSETAFVWTHEINTALRDDAVWVFMVLVPLGYPLLYSYIYNNEVVKDIPVAVVDEDCSSVSREFARDVDASQNAKVAERPTDLASARELMRQRRVYGIVYIPSDFSRNIATMRSATVYLFSDASTLLYYRQLAIACSDVSLALNAEIKTARGGGQTDKQDDIVRSPVKYNEVDIFNPQTGMATFLLPAVLMLILQQTMLLTIGITAGTMREKNRFRLFAPIADHAGGTFEIVLGRSLCYLFIYVANAFWVLGITPMLFRFERLAHFPDLAVFMVPYLLAICFMAQVVSHFIKTRESCMMIILFSSLFFLFVSGISWPWTAVPTFWKAMGLLAPSTLGINGFVRMTNEGARLSQVAPEYIGLWIQAAAYFLLAMLTTKADIMESCRAFRRSHRTAKQKMNRRKLITTREGEK